MAILFPMSVYIHGNKGPEKRVTSLIAQRVSKLIPVDDHTSPTPFKQLVSKLP